MFSLNDLIQRIVNAIIRQERMSPTYFNPGNLRAAPWLSNPKIVNGFWQPSSRAQGVAGLLHLLTLHIAEGNSLTDFIAGHPGVYAGFAPGADHNNPTAYIADVILWSGTNNLNATDPLYTFILS